MALGGIPKPRRVLLTVGATLLVGLAALLGFAAALPSAPDPVTEWNAIAATVTGSLNRGLARQRALAMVHLAIHDACNAVRPVYASYGGPPPAPAGASVDAAIAAAAHEVLRATVERPSPTLEVAYYRALLATPPGEPRRAGVAVGREAARRILALRAQDGADRAATALPAARAAPGTWEPTPPKHLPALLPGWTRVAPFVIPRADAFRPPPPPTIGSALYARQYEEVRQIGAERSPARTSAQSDTARLWARDIGEHWNAIARAAVSSQTETRPPDPLRTWHRARLYALLNLAMADGFLSGWEAKYHYRFWRPVTAIRQGARDGNPATAGDPHWSPLLPTPEHPEYPSTHSVLSGAAAQVLRCTLGTDQARFTVEGGERLAPVVRRYGAFSQAAREVVEARIYAGAHFRAANEEGLRQGERIGAWVCERALPPLRASAPAANRGGAGR